jgi:hypothetical protein
MFAAAGKHMFVDVQNVDLLGVIRREEDCFDPVDLVQVFIVLAGLDFPATVPPERRRMPLANPNSHRSVSPLCRPNEV